jgi:hypothetical protein
MEVDLPSEFMTAAGQNRPSCTGTLVPGWDGSADGIGSRITVQ